MIPGSEILHLFCTMDLWMDCNVMKHRHIKSYKID